MTVQAIAGLVLLNVLLLTVGISCLWGLKGWSSWLELARDLGLAYMLGTAALGIVLVGELVVGFPLTIGVLLVTSAALCGAAAMFGRVQRVPRPPLRSSGIGFGTVSFAGAVLAGLCVVYLEGLFRLARLHGLYGFDAWSFWVPKAKAIYFYGGLDEQTFTSLAGPSYPPLVPALEASAFRFMGSPDVVTLHLQFWFFAVGFVAAVAGVLSTRVPPLLLWPPLLLVLVVPRVATDSAIVPQADFLLDYFFGLAALLVALWVVERKRWQLLAAGVLLSAAMLTKREGYLLAVCVVIAACVASFREWRWTWPRLFATAAAAFVLTIPWRVWFVSHGLVGEGPDGGWVDFLRHGDRAWPSLRITLEVLFDYRLWLVVFPLVLAAATFARLGGARRLSTYAFVLYGLAVVAFSWVTWANVTLPFTKDESVNPIVRLSGSLIILAAALVPILFAAAWRSDERLSDTAR